MRSGIIDIVSGWWEYAGAEGYVRPSTASSSHYNGSIIPSAYYFAFLDNKASPSHGPGHRWYGYPLRWLAAEGEADPTVVRTTRRVDISRTEAEVVRRSRRS